MSFSPQCSPNFLTSFFVNVVNFEILSLGPVEVRPISVHVHFRPTRYALIPVF